MSSASVSTFLRDPRLAACAASPEPAWVWNTDATRVLWANAAGAALLGAATVSELSERRFAPNDRTAGQVARLSASLSQSGAPRLERMRGFGTGFLRPLTATCARIALGDGTQAIFILGAETIGHATPLAERTRRLFDGSDEAIAVFTPEGTLVYATPQGRQRTAGANTLVAFNASALALETLSTGVSFGDTLAGAVAMARIGRDRDTLLVLQFGKPVAGACIAAPDTKDAPDASEPPVAVVTVAPAEKSEADNAGKTSGKDASAQHPEPQQVAVPADALPPTPPMPAAARIAPAIDRQHPLRFVWQMDADENFTLASDDFIRLIGPATAQSLGKPWKDVAAALQLDPEGQVARAVATHDTWSGITVLWPVDDSTHRLKIELSGLPIYDRQRAFTGYRGFGVCRDIETFAVIAQDRRTKAVLPLAPPPSQPSSMPPSPEPQSGNSPSRAAGSERPALSVIPPVQNVLPFRMSAPAAPAVAPTAATAMGAEEINAGLNAGDRSAFSEIARQLTARLKTNAPAVRDDPSAMVLRTSPGVGIDGRAKAPVAETETSESATDPAATAAPAWLTQGADAHALVDKLPLGVLIYRFDKLFYANRSFLDQVGYADLSAFVEAGGLDSLFIETEGGNPNAGSQTLTITTGNGDQVPVEGRLFSIPWKGGSALALVLVGTAQPRDHEHAPAVSPPPLHDEDDLVRIAELEAAIAEARRIADAAAAERAELLGKIADQVREPMSSAVATLDTMLEERFGPIGNERYRTYLTDVRGSGVRILGLFEDLASLSKIEAVKTAPVRPRTNLNDVVKASVAGMQPEASRVRVLIRTSLASIALPVSGEAEGLGHIVTNLLTSSIRLAGPGGQVIVSTAPGGTGKVTLRLRDTGGGLNEEELAAFQATANPCAPLEKASTPENASANTPAGATDEKLTMAITRAMLDASQATLACTSRAEEGTLVEVTFHTTSI